MLSVLAVVLSATTAAAAFAQESPPGLVARVSYIGGSVSFSPAGTHEWTAAQLNWPMTIGARIWTDWQSRAEIQIADAVIRLGSRTGFSFLNLTERIAQMQLDAGTMIVHVRTLAEGGQEEVDTPNLALELEQPGTYRVEVNPAGNTTVVEVMSGAAIATGAGQTFSISAQQRATFNGRHDLNVAYDTLGPPDALDEWSRARDHQEEQDAAVETQYVSPQMVGIYDLNTYGSWEDTQWGYAWFPNVDQGWAPYRFGHWAWIFPWGWTWIDDEPWGFAPFHYGRWGFWRGAWCWVPGPAWERPLYAPALVAWTRRVPGHGPDVGWVPLGPRDVYVPGYAASESYVRKVNLSNTRALNARLVAAVERGRSRQTYRNSRVSGAITSVPRAAFVASQPADAHRIVLPRRGMLDLRFSHRTPGIIPSRASALGAGPLRIRQPPPQLLTDRLVVARLLPPRAPVAFGRQQTAMRANGGRPLTAAQWARLRPDSPVGAVRLTSRRPYGAHESSRNRFRGNAGGRPVSSAYPAVRGARPYYRADRPPWARSPGDRPQPHSGTFRRPTRRPVPHSSTTRSVRLRPRAPPSKIHGGLARYRFNGMPRFHTTLRSPPPMYRPQQAPRNVTATPDRAGFSPPGGYAPPRSPPPMYRPVKPHFAAGRIPSRPVARLHGGPAIPHGPRVP